MKKLLLVVALSWFGNTAWAMDTVLFAWAANMASAVEVDPLCIESEDVCKKRATREAKLRERCQQDPEWCENRKADKLKQREERQEMKAQCKENPEDCKALRQQFKENRKQERQATNRQIKAEQARWCEENPTDCKRWKAESRELQKRCQQMRRDLEKQYPDRPTIQDF